MTFLLTTAMVFFVRLQEHIFDVKFAKSIIIYSYLISIVLIMLPINPEVYSLWMIGGILIAMLVDGKLGLLVYFNLTFILSIAHSINIESTIQLLVMGVLFILLSAYLKTKTTVIYAAIILLSTNITLAFIMNNFIFETNSNVNYLSSFFSILAVVLTAFLLSTLYDRIALKHSINLLDDVSIEDKESFNPANPETITNNDEIKEDISVSDSSTRTSYEVLLSDNNELLQRMKKHSEGLYKHCILIGDLSGRAACIIGANEALARTGGYYHELGKIIGKNYIDEGIKLANEYAFPKELKEILKQHNIKHDKPTFVESAIVMISDNVLSTIEYIDKTGDQKFTSDKIIDNIFRMRMDKGTFDDSGLSIRDFKLLKDFYQKEFRGQGVETGRTKEDTH
jgi:putative nucleotidyltransferase with HDIG domain